MTPPCAWHDTSPLKSQGPRPKLCSRAPSLQVRRCDVSRSHVCNLRLENVTHVNESRHSWTDTHDVTCRSTTWCAWHDMTHTYSSPSAAAPRWSWLNFSKNQLTTNESRQTWTDTHNVIRRSTTWWDVTHSSSWVWRESLMNVAYIRNEFDINRYTKRRLSLDYLDVRDKIHTYPSPSNTRMRFLT